MMVIASDLAQCLFVLQFNRVTNLRKDSGNTKKPDLASELVFGAMERAILQLIFIDVPE
jgi:hypothetical protein